MPFKSEHAARVLSPKRFDRFARKKLGKGVSVILGITKGKTQIQAYRFDKSRWTPASAKAWLKRRKIKISNFEKAKS